MYEKDDKLAPARGCIWGVFWALGIWLCIWLVLCVTVGGLTGLPCPC